MKTNHTIHWQRIHTSRELAGEWRILRAKIRHVLDRTCALAGQLVDDEDAADAVDTLRTYVLDHVDGRPFRVSPIELSYALRRLLDLEPSRTYDSAA